MKSLAGFRSYAVVCGSMTAFTGWTAVMSVRDLPHDVVEGDFLDGFGGGVSRQETGFQNLRPVCFLQEASRHFGRSSDGLLLAFLLPSIVALKTEHSLQENTGYEVDPQSVKHSGSRLDAVLQNSENRLSLRLYGLNVCASSLHYFLNLLFWIFRVLATVVARSHYISFTLYLSSSVALRARVFSPVY
ncbi:unnamed protein product [Cylicostephanus goldi]|uniref:Uncharacterized protein n=1 Tax=Cylicostephanus goldi TaxID=71465 RepID=A0A3P6V2K9_CYLGO|nr:unnamed protein product [Cylicostephanus goldi]